MKSEIEIATDGVSIRLITVTCLAFVLTFTISGYAVNISGYHWSAFSDVKVPLRLIYFISTISLIPLGLTLLVGRLRALGVSALLVSAVGIAHFPWIKAFVLYMEPEKAASLEYLSTGIRIFGIKEQK